MEELAAIPIKAFGGSQILLLQQQNIYWKASRFSEASLFFFSCTWMSCSKVSCEATRVFFFKCSAAVVILMHVK